MLLTTIGPSRIVCSPAGMLKVTRYPYLPLIFLIGALNVRLIWAGLMMLTFRVRLLPPGPLKNVILPLDVTPMSTAVPRATPLPTFDPLGQALRRPRALLSVLAEHEGKRLPFGLPTPLGSSSATFCSRTVLSAGWVRTILLVSFTGVPTPPLGLPTLFGEMLTLRLAPTAAWAAGAAAPTRRVATVAATAMRPVRMVIMQRM